jgi:hypothetical protein
MRAAFAISFGLLLVYGAAPRAFAQTADETPSADTTPAEAEPEAEAEPSSDPEGVGTEPAEEGVAPVEDADAVAAPPSVHEGGEGSEGGEGGPPESGAETAGSGTNETDCDTHLVSLAFFTGVAQEGDFDAALANLGYSPAEWFWGFDLSVEMRITHLLWVGVRGDFRARQWGFWGGDAADAFGSSLLLLGDLRLPLNKILDVAGIIGGGFGATVVHLGDSASVAGLPRVHAGLQFGVTLFSGLRMHMGAAFDYAESLPINDEGHVVSFSIAAFRMGFEGRL